MLEFFFPAVVVCWGYSSENEWREGCVYRQLLLALVLEGAFIF